MPDAIYEAVVDGNKFSRINSILSIIGFINRK
jgi:hypothetical protein